MEILTKSISNDNHSSSIEEKLFYHYFLNVFTLFYAHWMSTNLTILCFYTARDGGALYRDTFIKGIIDRRKDPFGGEKECKIIRKAAKQKGFILKLS